ncbi:hypothetical protein EYF80_034005 [Liparis tanakae]|uniref:Uncharacterized protein n=1 Tax=Liparis tanakae TaxID=230148 RepID=A0A4Z2GQB2_9TELE|nr:hypothetical protein EYF80_034005 [Liparis tanakae]
MLSCREEEEEEEEEAVMKTRTRSPGGEREESLALSVTGGIEEERGEAMHQSPLKIRDEDV